MEIIKCIYKQNKKETSTLVLPTKVEETVPRKILESDYEFIREYAFKMKLKMLEATEIIHKKIRDEVEKNQHQSLILMLKILMFQIRKVFAYLLNSMII